MTDGDDITLIITDEDYQTTDGATAALAGKYGSLDLRSPSVPKPSPTISNCTIPSSETEPMGRPIYEKPADAFEISRLRSRLSLVASLSVIVFVVSFIGALWAASMALVVHSLVWLGLFAKLVLIMFLVQVRSSQASRLVTYRTRKWDLFLCSMSVILIAFGLGGAEYQVVEDFIFHDHQIKHSLVMMIFASVGLIAAIVIAFLAYPFLQGAIQRHKTLINNVEFSRSEKNRSQTLTTPFAKEKGLILKRTLGHIAPANQQCLLVLMLAQSLAAVVGSILIYFMPSVSRIDTLLAMAFAPLVIAMVVSVTKDALDVLVEGVLKGLDVGEMSERLIEIDGVLGVRKLRIWSLSMEKVSLSLTLSIDGASDESAILRRAADRFKDQFDVYEL